MADYDDDDEEVEHRLYKPKAFAPHWWPRRVLHSLTAVVIFLLYTVTIYPLHHYVLVPYASAFWFAVYYGTLAVTLATWLHALLSDPGSVPARWYGELAAGRVSVRDCTWCRKCAAPRPVRAHHCRICQQCVPFTGNCIGWANKKFFFQYVLATTVFTGAVVALVVRKHVVTGPVSGLGTRYLRCRAAGQSLFACFPEWVGHMAHSGGELRELAVFTCVLLAGAFCVATIMLGAMHVSMLVRGCTTYEDDGSPNAFALGWRRNVLAVLGPRWWHALLPGHTLRDDGTAHERAPRANHAKAE